MIQHWLPQASVGAALLHPGLLQSQILCCSGRVSPELGALAVEPCSGDAPSALLARLWCRETCAAEPSLSRHKMGLGMDLQGFKAVLGVPDTISAPSNKQYATSGGRWQEAEAVTQLVGITAHVFSVQGSQVRTVRRTSMTVQATTARMGAPAWMVSIPTTASVLLSGQVTSVMTVMVAQSWVGKTGPTMGDAEDQVGRALLHHSDANRACGSWAAPASCRCPVLLQVSTALRMWTSAS